MGKFTDFFSSNFVFDVDQDCQAYGIDIFEACQIHFSPDNGTVLRYGDVEPGYFKGNPDIAGLGILIGQASGVLVSGLALLFLLRELLRTKERRRINKNGKYAEVTVHHKLLDYRHERSEGWAGLMKYFRALIIATGDAQLIMAYAYGIHFTYESKCELSAYHYDVAVHTILAALAASTLAFIVIRDYWVTWITAAFRVAAMLVGFIITGRIMVYQYHVDYMPEYMYQVVKDRNDSAILLPIACFLDEDPKPFRNLTQQQRAQVDGSNVRGQLVSPEMALYGILATCFGLTLIVHVLRGIVWKCSRRRHTAYQPFGVWDVVEAFYYLSVIPMTVLVYSWCFGHNWIIREWVHRTDWMEADSKSGTTPEENVTGIGQLTAIAILFWTVVAGFDAAPRCDSSSQSKRHENRLPY